MDIISLEWKFKKGKLDHICVVLCENIIHLNLLLNLNVVNKLLYRENTNGSKNIATAEIFTKRNIHIITQFCLALIVS